MKKNIIIKLKENFKDIFKKENIVKIIFIAFLLVFAIASIIYYKKIGTVGNYINNSDWIGRDIVTKKVTKVHYYANIIGFITILSGLTISYLYMIKNVNKLFKTNKSLIRYILLTSIIGILILPFLSSDIFYYMATGRAEAKYKINPYYESVEQLMNENEESSQDPIVKKIGYWKDQTIVYGPVWPFICANLTRLSFGNIDVCLFLFKLANLLVHILNCILIYKICKKKKFVLLYGLNPLVILEVFANVHNDVWLVFFMLLGMYFLIKKKNYVLTLVFMAIAASIKYVTFLIMPFIVIWYFRKEKPIKRIGYAILSALIFVTVFGLAYSLYIKDFNVLNGIITQQNKLSKAIIAVIQVKLYEKNIDFDVIKPVNTLFILQYLVLVIRMLFDKKPSFVKYMRKYNVNLLVLTLLVLTNFWPWYLMWGMATIMWQRGKTIKNYIYITFACEVAFVVYAIFGENYKFDLYYILNVVYMFAMCKLVEVLKNKYKEEKINRNNKK